MDVKKIKLVLAIRSLNVGGAERQFIEIIKNIDKTKFEVFVCSMYGGIQEEEVVKIKYINYYNLSKNGRYDIIKFYNNYKKMLKTINPDVIYSFKEEMNIFSYFCKPKNTKIIWGFRSSNMDLSQYGKMSQFLFFLQKKLSSKIDMIISNSKDSISYHKKNNFDMKKAVVVPNGIDIDKFKRNDNARNIFRNKYKLKDTDIVIGIVARLDYVKGYNIFCQAAKRLLDETDNIFFFAIGDGNEQIKTNCESILEKHNNRFKWLGNQSQVEKFYSGFDFSCSSSLSESFSNSIAEAMSCELSCVITDVGDSTFIVDKYGVVVEPNNIDSLYSGLKQMLNQDFKKLGKLSRERIEQNFSIENMVRNTENNILKLLC